MANQRQRAVAFVEALLTSVREHELRSDPDRRPGLRNAHSELRRIRAELRSGQRVRNTGPWTLLNRALRITLDALIEKE